MRGRRFCCCSVRDYIRARYPTGLKFGEAVCQRRNYLIRIRVALRRGLPIQAFELAYCALAVGIAIKCAAKWRFLESKLTLLPALISNQTFISDRRLNEQVMGKAADSERIKLRAIFYNNIGVGLILAGVLLPYLAIYPKLGELDSRLSQVWDGTLPITSDEWKQLSGGAAGVLAAFIGGIRLRRMADKELTKLID